MSSHPRRFLACTVVLVVLALIPDASLANRAGGTLRDTFYFSPSWNYSVRWFADEWSVSSESSQNRDDVLVLQNAAGATVRFEGKSDYQGDARACLDGQLAALEAEGAQDIAVLTDDAQRPQKIYHPWRSWMLLIAAMPGDGGTSDQAVYLDCRGLDRDNAVFIRELRMPASIFATDLIDFDVLNAALPRSAWFGGGTSRLQAPGLDLDWGMPPLPADSMLPWEFPDAPHLMYSVTNGERGMLTTVDRDEASEDFVVVIENTSDAPLNIDPAQFVISSDPALEERVPEVPALSAVWTDGAAAGSRSIPPGATASLLLQFPPPAQPDIGTYLAFWDAAIENGGVALTCVSNCGYGGGGSRPKVRAMR